MTRTASASFTWAARSPRSWGIRGPAGVRRVPAGGQEGADPRRAPHVDHPGQEGNGAAQGVAASEDAQSPAVAARDYFRKAGGEEGREDALKNKPSAKKNEDQNGLV